MARERAKHWVVEKRVVVRPGSLEHGTQPTFAWARDDNFPAYATRNEAKIAFVTNLNPDLDPTAEAHCIRHFDKWARNVKAHRVKRYPEAIV